MIGHYVSMALRGLKRSPGYTVLKVVALALGLACFLGAYLVSDYYRTFDAGFANSDRIAVIRQQVIWPQGGQDFPFMVMGSGPVAKYLKADMPGLEAVARRMRMADVAVQGGDSKSYRSAFAADAGFLKIFDLPFIEGNAQTALVQPGSAVITAEAAQGIFGRTNVVGEALSVGSRVDVTVTGVIAQFPAHSHMGRSLSSMPFEIIFSMDVADRLMARKPGDEPFSEVEDWLSNPFTTYALLPADGSISMAQLNGRLKGFGERHIPKAEGGGNFDAIPVSGYLLDFINVTALGQMGLSLTTLLYLFGSLILGVACLDFVNLATAEAVPRAKEIGMRKTMGARRGQITMQCLVEVAALVFLSLLVALGVIALLIQFLNQPQDLGFRFPSLMRLDFWGVLIGMLAGVSLLAGGYPAMILGRVRPIFSLRSGGVTASRASVRAVLVGVQFAVASFLFIFAIVISMQVSAFREKALQQFDDAYVFVPTPLSAAGVDPRTFQTELLANPAIKGVTAVERLPWISGWSLLDLTKSQDPDSAQATVDRMTISYDYFSTMDQKILAGRAPRPDEVDAEMFSDDAVEGPNLVIDRQLAESFGWTPGEAVGQTIYAQIRIREDGQATRAKALPLTIIGVAENGPRRVNRSSAASTVYYLKPDQALRPIVRIDKRSVDEGLRHVTSVWDRLAPRVPLKYVFADEQLEMSLKSFSTLYDTIMALTGLSIVIAVMGLFGIARQVVSRRIREIGVRKSLGASTRQVMWLLLWDFSRPVLVANLVAWPLAYVLSRMFLSQFATRIDLTPLPFVLGLGLTIAAAWIAVGGQVFRAARLKPSQVLRYE